MTVKHWDTGLAARAQRDAAQYNLKLKLKKKIQPEVEATSRKRQAASNKLDKYIVDRIRWGMGLEPGEVDGDN